MIETRLAHIGYVVESMEHGYKQFLREGAQVLSPPVIDPIQKVEVCIIKLQQAELPIELVAPIDLHDNPVSARLKRGGGLDHICFYTKDLFGILEHEKKQGGTLVCDPVFSVLFQMRVAFVYRRCGLLVEYIEECEVI